MTANAVFPTPLPHDAGSHLGHSADRLPAAGHVDARVVAFEPLTAQEVCDLLQRHRAALHAELEELKALGEPVTIPADAVLLCELAGLVLDLTTGHVTGLSDGHVAPVPELRARLVEQGFVLSGAPAAAPTAAVNGSSFR